MVDFVGFADLFSMCFDFSDIFREQIEQERVDLRFKLDPLLHIQHQLALAIGVVVDGSQSSSEDTSTFGTHDENVFVGEGLPHCEATDWDHHVLLLSKHQEAFDWVL